MSLTKELRQAMVRSKLNHVQLAKKTGVQRQSLIRFLRGDQSLRLDNADAIAKAFGLVLVEKKRKK
jgi:DNA-binding phage protein